MAFYGGGASSVTLSNIVAQNSNANGGNANGNAPQQNEEIPGDLFLANLINSFSWNNTPRAGMALLANDPPPSQHNPVLNDDYPTYNNFLGAIGTRNPAAAVNPIGTAVAHLQPSHSRHFPPIPENAASSIGIGGSSRHYNGGLSRSFSPSSSGSSSSRCASNINHVIGCARCDHQATNRCLDCNDTLCEDCVNHHSHNEFTHDHCIVSLTNVSPIGSTVSNSNGSPPNSNVNVVSGPQCDSHREIIRYVCQTCKTLVCQECTLWDHKEPFHVYVPVATVVEGGQDRIRRIQDSGRTGTKLIKNSIDRAVAFSQSVERDALDVSGRIRKTMRHLITILEERERHLIDRVEKIKLQKLTTLSDQMAGLRAALAGLSQTSETLSKTLDTFESIPPMDLVQTIMRCDQSIDQFATMYKSLQPQEEFISFISPGYDTAQGLRIQGDVILKRAGGSAGPTSSTGSLESTNSLVTPMARRAIVRTASTSGTSTSGTSTSETSDEPPPQISTWEPEVKPQFMPWNKPQIGLAIPASTHKVVIKLSETLTDAFALDGHTDGRVSRPWGLCVDRDGNILVADRRNNRVQVFYSHGDFRFKFGSKGTMNGQFDLPAGISTDPQNRIVVVDKDNHRVQVFSSKGNFILKFGSYGKECGQFQYPWDVAVNSRGEMLITDSRNHRIQLFNQDGLFINRLSFDGMNHVRTLKGLTTPRGVCFTPDGNILVTDFENHRLLLIDGGLSKIITSKGYEGYPPFELCRPSGLCCDDEGRVILADSKNQRVIYLTPQLDLLHVMEIRPSSKDLLPSVLDEKDRPSDVAILPDGRLVVMVETSPDARENLNPNKTFIQIY